MVLELERRPDFILLNLFTPSIILSSLSMFAYFLPAHGSERPSFTATILVSFFVLQEYILNLLPASPNPIIASYYIIANTICTMIVTIYSSIMGWLMGQKKRQNRLTTVDNIVWSCFLFLFLLLHFTTFLTLSL